ncbi:hypothetical protein ACIRTB_00485 [Streptomyces sp. NPDC101158]|uniref:hypothetical protein n=1 Tax=Streptomyces sp. NPDC101158 TaxID=3366117 RepID=UPI00382450BD
MAYRTTKLRVATAVATALIAGAAPATLAQAQARAPQAQAPAAQAGVAQGPAADVRAPSPSPDPFRGLTADQIGDKAVAATQSATSLRMAGRVTTGGQPLDVDFSVNDKNQCTGRIKLQGGAAELRQTGGLTYMKGDEKFWRASMASQGMPEPQIEATIELLKGRWLKIAPGQAGSGDLGGVCDLKGLLSDLGRNKAERTGLVRGPDAEVKGTPVATLVKRKPHGETTTVSVSQRGKPYILKMVKTGGAEPGSVVLSDYDKPVKVVVPPEDETVDLTKLDQGSTAERPV